MAKPTQWIKLSGWLFLLGILIAIVDGVGIAIPEVSTYLVVIGFLVGILAIFGMGAIGKSNTEMFLLATIALVAAGGSGAVLSNVMVIGSWLAKIVGHIATLVAPIAVIIAIKVIWDSGSTKLT